MLILAFFLTACTSQKIIKTIPRLENTTWQWINTGGGITGTTLPADKELFISFEPNNKLSITIDGETIISKKRYDLIKVHETLLGPFYKGDSLEIHFDESSISIIKKNMTSHIVLNGLPLFEGDTLLSIIDNKYDGYGSTFRKVKLTTKQNNHDSQ